MSKLWKRRISYILVSVFLITLTPVNTFANETNYADTKDGTITIGNSGDTVSNDTQTNAGTTTNEGGTTTDGTATGGTTDGTTTGGTTTGGTTTGGTTTGGTTTDGTATGGTTGGTTTGGTTGGTTTSGTTTNDTSQNSGEADTNTMTANAIVTAGAPLFAVTELCANPKFDTSKNYSWAGTCASGNDVFEFVELVNISTQAIDIKNYSLNICANYETDQTWRNNTFYYPASTTGQQGIIDPGEAAVILVYTFDTAKTTLDWATSAGRTAILSAFNEFYGSSVDADHFVIAPCSQHGQTDSKMAGTDNLQNGQSVMGVRLVNTTTDEVAAEAFYNDSTTTEFAQDGLSCEFTYYNNCYQDCRPAYDSFITEKSSILTSGSVVSNPGTYKQSQVPAVGDPLFAVTELCANPKFDASKNYSWEGTCATGNDVFEFVELVNITNQPVDIKNYSLNICANYETDRTWRNNTFYYPASTTGQQGIINPGEPVVILVYTFDTAKTTLDWATEAGRTAILDAFNEFYGSGVDADHFVIAPCSQHGQTDSKMDGTDNLQNGQSVLGVRLVNTTTKAVAAEAFYNDSTTTQFSQDGLSSEFIYYPDCYRDCRAAYSNFITNKSSILTSGSVVSNPGTYKTSQVPTPGSPLFAVTELCANPDFDASKNYSWEGTCASGNDVFEFVELVNITNQPINIKNYSLKICANYALNQTWRNNTFYYPASSTGQQGIIDPGEAAVILVYTFDTAKTTLDWSTEAGRTAILSAFNQFYGSNVDADHFAIAPCSQHGQTDSKMPGTDNLQNGQSVSGVRLVNTATNEVAAEAFYNDSTTTEFSQDGLSAEFMYYSGCYKDCRPTYDDFITNKSSILTSGSVVSNPGTYKPSQVPSSGGPLFAVTELCANPKFDAGKDYSWEGTCASGNDVFEFVELVNVSNQPVDIKNYSLNICSNYETDRTWRNNTFYYPASTTGQQGIINPGEAVVIQVYTFDTAKTTLDWSTQVGRNAILTAFNQFYGSNVDADHFVIAPCSQHGQTDSKMPGTDNLQNGQSVLGVRLVNTSTNDVVAEAFYNDSTTTEFSQDGYSAEFMYYPGCYQDCRPAYESFITDKSSIVASGSVVSNPGTYKSYQIQATSGPLLAVTEVCANPKFDASKNYSWEGTCATGNDVFEFVELVNISKNPVNIKNYSLNICANYAVDRTWRNNTFYYPASSTGKQGIINPGEAVVIQVYTFDTAKTTLDWATEAGRTAILSAFNEFYGSNVDADHFVIAPCSQHGQIDSKMDGTDNLQNGQSVMGVRLVNTSTKAVAAEAFYNDSTTTEFSQDGLSAEFTYYPGCYQDCRPAYDSFITNKSSIVVSGSVESNPGTFKNNQVPISVGPLFAVTELCANPSFDASKNYSWEGTCATGNDVFEFVELVNISGKPVDIKNYSLNICANYDSDRTWRNNTFYYPASSTGQQGIIDPGEAVIIQVYTFDTAKTTLDWATEAGRTAILSAFNQFYGSSVDADHFVIAPCSEHGQTNAKMPGTDNLQNGQSVLGVRLVNTSTKEVAAEAFYNDSTTTQFAQDGYSAEFMYYPDCYRDCRTAYDSFITNKSSIVVSGSVTSNPGTYDADKVPAAGYSAPPTIDFKNYPGRTATDNTITVLIKGSTGIRAATLFYKTETQTQYSKLLMNAIGRNSFAADIPSATMASAKNLSVYFSGTDGIGRSESSIYNIPLNSDGPSISSFKPSYLYAFLDTKKPTISASYSHASGIYTAGVKLLIDNNDVTSGATVTSSGISYTAPSELLVGKHTVELIATANNTAKSKTDYKSEFYVSDGTDLNHYKGEIHSHSTDSDGQGTVSEAYTYARDTAKVDFFGLSDHAEYSAIGGSSPDADYINIPNKMNVPGTFATLPGYEWTQSQSMGPWVGHMDVFNYGSNTVLSWSNTKSIPDLYSKISAQSGVIAQFNHPGYLWGDFAHYASRTDAIDAKVDLAEINNASYDAQYNEMLSAGWHVAPLSNEDNHSKGWATTTKNIGVILTPALTRDNIIDAIRHRRTYSAGDPDTRINYSINGQVMGSILNNPSTLNFSIHVTHPTRAAGTISIIADGGVVVASQTFTTNDATWNFTLPALYDHYHVKVMQGSDYSVTAPIWTTNVKALSVQSLNYNVSSTYDAITNLTTKNIASEALNNVTVSYYTTNNITGTPIGTASIGNIAAGQTGSVSKSLASVKEKTLLLKITGTGASSGKTYSALKEIFISGLMISEVCIAPNSGGYQFLEIYNNSSSAIDLSGYRVDLWARTGDDPNNPPSTSYSKRCDFSTSNLLQPGKTHIVICYTDSDSGLTNAQKLAKFNSFYNTSLTLNDVDFVYFTIAKSYTRLFELETDSNYTVSRVYTNEFSVSSPDYINGTSVQYTYPKGMIPDGTKLSNSASTPGTVSSGQGATRQ
ncbi:MAG: CehA/McbA family metallohydrolase [Bacillota bacterium]|nr:CehA/McbA family metallohydrolase [Bacillota bacterium]